MIGHPNNSGLQMDQVTHLYIPPFFVDEVRIRQDDKPILAMSGGISISEDPNIRFTYIPDGAKKISVEAKDTDGHIFQGEWPVDASGMSAAIAASARLTVGSGHGPVHHFHRWW